MSDFNGMIKHVGVLNNTGKNVVVAFMRLPGDPNHALVIDTDALPDQYNEALRKIVESVEGQQSKDLAEVLGRRMSPDGSNMTLLEKFHGASRLEKVPVKLVTMTPRKGIRWPLEQVLSAMDSAQQDDSVGFDDLDPETKAAVAADLKRFNVHANNMQGEATSNNTEQAVSLIRQAELMEADAQLMRMKAYKIDPGLMPKSKKVDPLSVDLPMGVQADSSTKPKDTSNNKPAVETPSSPDKRSVPKRPVSKKTSAA